MPDRVAADNVTVFSVGGGDLLAHLEGVTFKTDVKHEEAKGLADSWRYPWGQDQGWDLECDLFAGQNSTLMDYVGQSLPMVWSVGGTTYSGTALVTMGHHDAKNSSLTKQKLSLLGQGQYTRS